MNTQRRGAWMLSVLAICLAAWLGLSADTSQGQTADKPAAGKPPKNRDLQSFMRKKLAASNQILEGLCTEDMDLVKQGAHALNEMSAAEKWHVSNDVMYKQFSNDFRQITKALEKAAEEGNADRATLKWLDATVSCLDCHRFVRGERIVESR